MNFIRLPGFQYSLCIISRSMSLHYYCALIPYDNECGKGEGNSLEKKIDSTDICSFWRGTRTPLSIGN